MPRLDVQIPAPDGHSPGTLHIPDGAGPWPGVLVFPDAGGARETFGQMGDRLAGLGYVALIPDIYYRAGEWTPFDVGTLFTDPQERARMSGLVSSLPNDAIFADAGAYEGFLPGRADRPVRGRRARPRGPRGGLVPRRQAGRCRRSVEPAPVGGPHHRRGLRGRRHRGRLVHHRARRAAGPRAHRRRGAAHRGVLPSPPWLRGARQ